jgi:hypothetical protein
MYVKPTSPQSIGQVLDGSFRLTAASLRHTWVLALLAGLASYAATVYQFTRGGGALAQPFTVPQDPIYWILYVTGLLLTLLFLAAIYLRIDAVASGDPDGSNALAAAVPRLPLLVVIWILYMLAVIIGCILLVVPGMIVLVSMMLAMPIFLFEDKGPIASLTSSHRLVWGHWWRTAVILTVAGIVILVLYFIVAFIAAAIAPLAAGGEALLATLISAAIVLALLGIIVTPFMAALLLNIYWDLKLRKEGGDLVARAQAA